jgi:hypothetical protein
MTLSVALKVATAERFQICSLILFMRPLVEEVGTFFDNMKVPYSSLDPFLCSECRLILIISTNRGLLQAPFHVMNAVPHQGIF